MRDVYCSGAADRHEFSEVCWRISDVTDRHAAARGAKWRTNIPNYGRVEYKSVYAGVDLVYYGNPQKLEYDLIVAPGADPRVIQVEWPC